MSYDERRLKLFPNKKSPQKSIFSKKLSELSKKSNFHQKNSSRRQKCSIGRPVWYPSSPSPESTNPPGRTGRIAGWDRPECRCPRPQSELMFHDHCPSRASPSPTCRGRRWLSRLQTVSQSGRQSVNQSVRKTVSQSGSQEDSQSISRSANQSVSAAIFRMLTSDKNDVILLRLYIMFLALFVNNRTTNERTTIFNLKRNSHCKTETKNKISQSVNPTSSIIVPIERVQHRHQSLDTPIHHVQVISAKKTQYKITCANYETAFLGFCKENSRKYSKFLIRAR